MDKAMEKSILRRKFWWSSMLTITEMNAPTLQVVLSIGSEVRLFKL